VVLAVTTGLVLSPQQAAARDHPNVVGLQQAYRYGRMLYLMTDLYIGRSIRHLGEYSQLELERLLPYVPEGGVVVDIGANHGTHTVAFARKVGAHGAVFSFEPQPFLYYLLCGNIAINGLLQCQAHRSVMAHEPGIDQIECPDYATEANFGGYSIPAREREGVIPTNVTTLDHWRFNRCDVVKIDVEGMETMVLRGGYQTIRRHRPVLWVECEPQPQGGHLQLLAWLRSHLPDYTVEKISTPLDNPGNFAGEREPLFEGVVTRNLLCLPVER
jgi:FkbM family methyltransferase